MSFSLLFVDLVGEDCRGGLLRDRDGEFCGEQVACVDMHGLLRIEVGYIADECGIVPSQLESE